MAKADLERIAFPLDGAWEMAPVEQAVELRWWGPRIRSGLSEGFPIATRKVRVPSAWNDGRDPELNLFRGSCVYIKDFRLPAAFKGRRTVLRFDAVGQRCTVYLDGEALGSHEGGYTPFSFDLAGKAAPGRSHRLVVVANNQRSEQTFPAISGDFESYGGIYRSVEIIGLPAVHMDKMLAIPSLSADGRGELSISVSVRNDSKRRREIELRAAVTGRGLKYISTRAVTVKAGAVASVTLKMRIPGVSPWSPESPAMYDLAVSAAGDRLRKRVGFRRIEVKGNHLLLNGRPIRLRGANRHDDHPDFGPCLPDAVIRRDLELAKSINCNALRLAHYPHREKTYELADELGILLWTEIPFVGGDVWTGDVRRRNLALQNMLRELIERDCHHPSVILWSVGNEVASDHPACRRFMAPLYKLARRMDKTRLVTFASNRGTNEIVSQPFSDVAGVNQYYGWYSASVNDVSGNMDSIHRALGKPIIVSEFGAECPRGRRGRKDRWTEDYQVALYRHNLRVLGAKRYVVGLFPWALFDFRSHRRMNVLQHGWNRKGIFDDRRRPKLVAKVVREFYGRMARGEG